MRKRSDIVNYMGLEILCSYRMTPGLLWAHHILMDSNKPCVSPSLLYPKDNSWVFIWPFIHCQRILSYYLRNQSWTVIYFPTGRRWTLVISEMWVQLQGHPEESAPPSLALHSSHMSLCRDTWDTRMMTAGGEQRLQKGAKVTRSPSTALPSEYTGCWSRKFCVQPQSS